MKEKAFEIIQIDDDTYKIVSNLNDETVEVKKTVDLARKMQSINANARLKMIKWMKSEGINKSDLIDKKTVNGKIVYDETTYRDLERGFIADEAAEVSNEIINILCGMSLVDLVIKLGLDDNYQDESLRLGKELNKIITGNPR